ncbi:hypothetical protein MMPV_000819 [Pyropia vietnamensis]
MDAATLPKVATPPIATADASAPAATTPATWCGPSSEDVEGAGAAAAAALPKPGGDHARLISRYHALLKRIASVNRDAAFPTPAARSARRAVLRAQLAALGGHDAYQRASLVGEAAGGGVDASAWVLAVLAERLGGGGGMDPAAADEGADKRADEGAGGEVEGGSAADGATNKPADGGHTARGEGSVVVPMTAAAGAPAAAAASPPPSPLVVLDVGSIRHRFPDTLPLLPPHPPRALHVTSIDLAPADDRVRRVDFFDYAAAASPASVDVLVLSLVVNYVADPTGRGRMLAAAAALTRPGGLLCLVLPRACVANSRYMNEAALVGLLAAIGWAVVAAPHSPRLGRWVAVRQDTPATPSDGRGSRKRPASHTACPGGSHGARRAPTTSNQRKKARKAAARAAKRR